MPLFIMLSGAVFALKPMTSFKAVLDSKAKRLLIPYYFWAWFWCMILFSLLYKMFENAIYILELEIFCQQRSPVLL